MQVIRCFLVTERGINAEYLAGLPVVELDTLAHDLSEEEKVNLEILIATPDRKSTRLNSSHP